MAERMEDLFDEMLMQARASGIEQPMLLLLSPNSQQAQTIYQALHGAPLLGPGFDAAEFVLRGAGFAVHSKFRLDPEFLY